MKKNNYTALIGDIIGSKKLPNRNGVQIKLNKALETINKVYESSIESKFIITLGDEFQGLLKSNVDIMPIIKYLQFEMYPVKLRIGLGIGTIYTEITHEYAIGADGPAYYNARSAIEYLEQNENKNTTHNTFIYMVPNEGALLNLINLSFSTFSSLAFEWNDDLYQTVKLIEKNHTQQATANQLKINQSTVKRRLEKARYYEYRHIYDVLHKTLEEGI